MAEVLGDSDIPREVGLWSTLLFLLDAESPRMSELRLGVWSFLWGLIVAWPGNHWLSQSPIFAWLAHIPQALVGWPMLVLGLYQVWAVLARRTDHRLWAARLQTVVSVVFALGCASAVGLATPAFVFYVLNALWSIWVLYRLAPTRRV